MKFRKRLPLFKRQFARFMKQKGQTLVEFVLLLAVISSISYAFVSIMNSNLGMYWEHCVNLVVTDNDPNKPKVTLE